MKKILKPYFTAANSKMGNKPESFGLISNKTIDDSAYKSKCDKKKK
jgi:hypothetical protein